MSDSQDRTEEPTAKRLGKARAEGQIARSTELPAAAIVISTLLMLTLMGGWMITRLASQFANGFVFDHKTLERPALLPGEFVGQMAASFMVIAPILILTVIMAIAGSVFTGGLNFAPGAIGLKLSKLNPVTGLKRMFGMHALVELLKAVFKFSLVAGALWITLAMRANEIARIGQMALEPALTLASAVVLESALAVSLALALIALFDVPYQRFTYIKGLRMSRQEIKDEHRQAEGNPEVKAKIRRRQREMANSRMIERIKDADVIITNPEHFAVALEYDPSGDGAPTLVAKGSDFMAAKIREEAARHGVHIFPSAELARALYFTTEPEQPVPEALYHAVAQVIAYVFSLEGAQPGRATMKRPSPEVPPVMRFDAQGRRTERAQNQPA